MPPGFRTPPLDEVGARRGDEHERQPAHPLDEAVDEREHEIVGPVQVRQRDDQGLLARDAPEEAEHRADRVVARSLGVDVVQLLGVPEQVQQAA